MNKVDLAVRFAFPYGDEFIEKLASMYTNLAYQINNIEADSREKVIAIERLEESFMWACKGQFNLDD